MRRFLLARLVAAVPGVVAASVLAFLGVRALPGDPARVIAGERATPETLRRARERFGLDRPLPVQYARFLTGLATGDLRSLRTGAPVLAEFGRHGAATLELALAALAWSVPLGLVLGARAAARPRGPSAAAARAAGLVGVAVPVFVLGYTLLWARLALGIPWIAGSGRAPDAPPEGIDTPFLLLEGIARGEWGWAGDCLRHILLPALVLGSIPLAVVTRMQQASLRDASGADYLRTARAKGLGPAAVWIRHAGRNAAVPVATALGVSAGHLLGGAVLTETVFGWPGLGRYLVEGVGARDYPVVQGFVIGFCLVRVAASLATDLACAALDPRLRDVAARAVPTGGRAA